MRLHLLKNFQGDAGTGLGIGQRVVMPLQIEAASRGDGLELVVFEGPAETVPRRSQRIVKEIIGIIHLIDPENGLETALVETGVVGDQLLAQQTGGNGIHRGEDSDFRGFFLSLYYEQHRKSI